MQIFVKSLAGATVPVAVESTTTVADLKALVEESLAMPVDCQRLVFAGMTLEDDMTVIEEVQKEAVINVVMDVIGGKGKKKKKKTFSGAKKTKKPKNKALLKMRVLKYFKIENDSVVPTRVCCPQPSCDKSVLLAVHSDRRSCGKCGATFAKQ